MQNLVAAFGRWGWDAAGQDRGVESYYGYDYVCDHYGLRVDEDAVGEPDDGAEGLDGAQRFVIAEKIGCGDDRSGKPAD